MIEITVNGHKIEAGEGKSILSTALNRGIYIPHLCYHPQLEASGDMMSEKTVYQEGLPHSGKSDVPYPGCNLCLVEIDGHEGPVQACRTMVRNGMAVSTDSEVLTEARTKNIVEILQKHPHACLVCAQSSGCDRKICSLQIPEDERCCEKFGICELQKVADYIGIKKGLPPYLPLQKKRGEDKEPLFKRNYDLCIGCLRCVRICRDVREANALRFTVINERVVVGSKERTLKGSNCLFCGYCVEVCPTGALSDKDICGGKRENNLIPCRSKCPAEIDVPRYVRLVAEGKFGEAAAVVREKVPFPGVLGRVCFHPCETVCRRESLDQPVAICALKRAAACSEKKAYAENNIGKRTGRKVAVVGSGPAGLTAAFYLNVQGHSVTVFEAMPEAGGMLRSGIPAYRLPRHVLDGEIKTIEDQGVEIKTGCPVASLDKLLAEGFQAIFLAVGANKGLKLDIPGHDTEGVIDGVAFLNRMNIGRREAVGKRIAVVGGGNVAFDSARTALRAGGEEVTLFYRRTREEMPAYDEEIEVALEEGIKIEYQVVPLKIYRTGTGFDVQFVRTEMGDIDEGGRRRPVLQAGSEFIAQFDAVISAIGQASEVPEGVVMPHDLPNKRPAMVIDAERGIFAGGDLLTGPLTVIDAVAAGRAGAVLIDKFLGGDGDIERIVPNRQTGVLKPAVGPAVDKPRSAMPALAAQERIKTFSEVNLGFDDQTACSEARRCLGCDLRFQIKPAMPPPERCLILARENIHDLPDREGVYRLYDAQKDIYKISGVENLRRSLLEECEAGSKARYFDYEEYPMFTMKERQLIQQYMKKGCGMPPGNAELDDLF